MVHKYLECCCHSADHTLRFSYLEDDPEMVYVEVHLVRQRWWKRIWPAIKYVLGFQCRYGAFDEFCWEREQVTQLRDCCNEWLESTEDKQAV